MFLKNLINHKSQITVQLELYSLDIVIILTYI